MVVKPKFGNWLSVETLNALDKYFHITMEEPWKIIEPNVSNKPAIIKFNYNMDLNNINQIFNGFEPFITEDYAIVGIGGGIACDTTKFLSWKFKVRNIY